MLSKPPLTHHWCRIKLRDDVMEENCQVSRPRLQQVHTLKWAAFSINLMQKDTNKEESVLFLEKETERLILLQLKH